MLSMWRNPLLTFYNKLPFSVDLENLGQLPVLEELWDFDDCVS